MSRYSGFWAGTIFFISGVLGLATAATHLRFIAFMCGLFGFGSIVAGSAAVAGAILQVKHMENSYQLAYFRTQLQQDLIVGYATDGILMGASGAMIFVACVQVSGGTHTATCAHFH